MNEKIRDLAAGRQSIAVLPAVAAATKTGITRHGRGPRALLIRYRMGIFSALAGDLMFFMALVTAFFFRQSTGHFDPRGAYMSDWQPLAIPPVLYINTAILLVSSVTMEMARRQLFHEVDVMEEWLGMGRPAARRAAPWLAATVALGIAFLIGQWMAWKDLASQGFFFASNPSSHFFYLITGAHGAHLVLGVLALVAAFAALSCSTAWRCGRSSSTAPPGTGTPWASSGSSSSACSSSSSRRAHAPHPSVQ